MKNWILALAMAGFLPGCTTVGGGHGAGVDRADFQPAVELRVCVLRDEAVSPGQAAEVMAAVREVFAPYGLAVTVPWVRPWQRPAFANQGISRDVAERALEPPCDRLLALVGRDTRDFLWGALMPEVLGAVETRTRTRGFAVAQTGSLNQVLTFSSPADIAVHEVFHLLGCAHGTDPAACTEQIRRARRAALDNRAAGRDFFPSLGPRGRTFLTRAEADRRFRIPAAAGTCDPRAAPC